MNTRIGRTPRQSRGQDTRANLLQAAVSVFSESGLHGGSVSRIAKLAESYDRMIYYYFGSKEGLFVATLEEMYRQYNEAESSVELNLEQPVDALKKATIFFVRYFRDHPEFVTVLNSENLHKGKHISQSLLANQFSKPAIGLVHRVLQAGKTKGIFRVDISPRDIYVMISAMGYFYQSNQYTLSAFLDEPLRDPKLYDQWEAFVVDAVLRTVRTSLVELG